MSKPTSVIIGDQLAEFIDRQIEEGRYRTASEVVWAGLQLLEEQDKKLADLRAALIEGEQSGPAGPFDVEAFLQEMHRKRASRG